MAAPEELNPSEWKLMKVVWREAPATVREIHQEVEGETGWAPSTTKTLLERMERKGLLRVNRVGPVRQYSAARKQKDLVPRAVKRFLDRVLDDSMTPLVRYLADARGLKPEEVRRLRKLLEDDPE